MRRKGLASGLFLSFFGVPLLANAAPAVPAAPAGAPDIFVYLLIGVLGAVGLIALIFINLALAHSKWSLADALSEDTDMPVLTNGTVQLDSTQKPILAPQLVASTSRVIALFGLFGILLLFVGIGIVVLYYFAKGQGVPSGITDVRDFLVAGITMFAPYLVNKFASVFESLAPRRSS